MQNISNNLAGLKMNEKSPTQNKPLKKLLLIALIALVVGHALM